MIYHSRNRIWWRQDTFNAGPGAQPFLQRRGPSGFQDHVGVLVQQTLLNPEKAMVM